MTETKPPGIITLFRDPDGFRSCLPGIVASTALVMVATVLEASALVMIAALAQGLAEGTSGDTMNVGPFSFSGSTSQLLGAVVVAIVISAVFNLLSIRVRSAAVRAWSARMQRRIMASFLAADWAAQHRIRTGRSGSLVIMVRQSVNALNAASFALRGLVSLAVLLASAVVVDWQAATALLLLGTVLFVVMRPLGRAARIASKEATEVEVQLAEESAELALLSKEIHTFDAAETAPAMANDLISRSAAANHRMDMLEGSVIPIYQSAGIIVLVAGIALASDNASADLASLGAVALLVLRGILYGQQFQGALQRTHRFLPLVHHFMTELEEFSRSTTPTGGRPLDTIDQLTFRQVGYDYGGGEAALDAVTFTMAKGEIVGIAGPSGAGKTTLVEILLRLRLPTVGSVQVNGEDYQDFERADWYRQVALVPQEPHLLRGTVAENLRFFRELSDEEIQSAAHAAGVADVIDALPQGYETPIGPSYRGLSGGQKQRLGIARALAGTPSLLVLDEPTSALDADAEATISATVRQLKGEVAVLIVAHRLSTLEDCDRVVMLRAGRITAIGPPEEVLHHRGQTTRAEAPESAPMGG